jgi:hypothetical protein
MTLGQKMRSASDAIFDGSKEKAAPENEGQSQSGLDNLGYRKGMP